VDLNTFLTNLMSKNLFINVTLLVTLSLILIVMGLDFSITKYPLVGDSASHTLQALSIARDLDLKYDACDGQYWQELNWSDNPDGLFFQSYSGGYAFAKPYAYSLFLALFIIPFGMAGFAIGNVLIFGLINVFVFLTLRVFYGKIESILLTVSFTFFSYVYMYVFYIHSDLFLALLCAFFVFLFTKLLTRASNLNFTALCLVAAFIVAEKPPAVLVVLPILLVYFYKTRSIRTVVSFCLIFSAGFLLFVFPYLYYSDYKSWNPYNGNRFYATTAEPFTFNRNLSPSSYQSTDSGRHFNLSKAIKRTFSTSKTRDKLKSFYYYFFGAYTGMLVFFPLAFIILTLSIFRIINKPDFQFIATFSGLFSYILFYVILFHANYYGGGHSLGNRYFLQISPILILLILGLKFRKKQVFAIFILSLGLSAIFLYRHHLEPQHAHVDIVKAGYIQKMMPFEVNQGLLQPYVMGDQIVNMKLYPSPPRWVRYDYIIGLEDKDIVVQTPNFTNQNKWYDINGLSDVFRETTLNNKFILLNTGFYQSEHTHVWSRKESSILLENSNNIEIFSVNSFMPSTLVKVNIGDNEQAACTPFSLIINTSGYKNKWILVHFEADRSGIPSIITKSRDTRELSFYLAYRNNKKYQQLEFGHSRKQCNS